MLKGKSIFIVEDDTMNRVVYTIILKKVGCNIEFDIWGRDVVKKLEQRHFDIIILDLMLPRGDSGFSIYEKIRQVPDYDDTPIIAVSANEPAVAIPMVQKLGFNGYITKPLDKDLFPKQLEQLLNGENVWYTGSRL